MRSKPALAALLAAVALVALGSSGCGGEESASEPAVQTMADPADPNVPVVPCETISGGGRYSGTGLDDRIVLDVIYVPPTYEAQAAIPSRKKRWPYFAEAGLVIRGGVSPIEISVAQESRDRAAISWGTQKVAHSLAFPSCPPYGLPWNVYEGGFHLRERTACVPLTFESAGRKQTVRFGIGERCKPA